MVIAKHDGSCIQTIATLNNGNGQLESSMFMLTINLETILPCRKNYEFWNFLFIAHWM